MPAPKDHESKHATNVDSLRQLESDVDVRRAFEALDGPALKEVVGLLCESAALHLNFEAYKRSLQSLQARVSKLSSTAKAGYAERATQSAKDARASLAAAERLSAILSRSGVDRILVRHKQPFFRLTPDHPYTDGLTRLARDVGASDSDISHYAAQLRSVDWDPFRLGTNGEFSGLVDTLRARVSDLEKESGAAKVHGPPALEGADPTGGVLFTMVAVGLISCSILNQIHPGNCILNV